jgi:hypothetical protein
VWGPLVALVGLSYGGGFFVFSRREADMSADERHYSAEQVTGARQEGVVRWVLVISLLLIVVAMSAMWIIPALTG